MHICNWRWRQRVIKKDIHLCTDWENLNDFLTMIYDLKSHWRSHKVILFKYTFVSISYLFDIIIKTQIFHDKKFDLKGHWRLLLIFFAKLEKKWMLTLFKRCIFFIKWSKTSKLNLTLLITTFLLVYIIVLIFRVGWGYCYPWGRWFGWWYGLEIWEL